MRHQYLSFPQLPCLSSGGNALVGFFMVLGGFTEESPLSECAPDFCEFF